MCIVWRHRWGLLFEKSKLKMKRLMLIVLVLGVVAIGPWKRATETTAARETELAEQSTSSEPLVIVVNRLNSEENLSFSDLHQIFLGTRRYWSDGKRITLVMREPGEAERNVILRDVCGLTEEQFKTHFLRGLYTGDIIVSPKTLSTPQGVKRFIFNVPGAIGYLRMSDVDANVKVIRIDERFPGDKGYRLRVPNQAVN